MALLMMIAVPMSTLLYSSRNRLWSCTNGTRVLFNPSGVAVSRKS